MTSKELMDNSNRPDHTTEWLYTNFKMIEHPTQHQKAVLLEQSQTPAHTIRMRLNCGSVEVEYLERTWRTSL